MKVGNKYEQQKKLPGKEKWLGKEKSVTEAMWMENVETWRREVEKKREEGE